jgi:putative DNA methylase
MTETPAMPTPKRKLIEVAMPLEAISSESGREKSIRRGHPSTLHLWWARRPLAASRAVLFAQLVDDPSAHADLFPTLEAQAEERERLFDLIREAVKWESTNSARVTRQLKAELNRYSDGNDVTLADPFAGGGSIPLEAQRLGLHAWANDLNPLPVLLNMVQLDTIGRFNLDRPTTGGLASSPSAALAADVEEWASILEERVAARMSSHYPAGPSGAESLVYFWARTVTCPNPACGLEIPLVGSWRASGRRGSEAMFLPVINSADGTVDVQVKPGKHPEPPKTMARTGGECLACGASFPLAYVKSEGMAGRMGARMLAVQERTGKQRSFRPATDADRKAASVRPPETPWLDADLSTHPQYMAPPRYGLTTFRDLFLPRQLMTLTALVEELDTVVAEAEAVAVQAGMVPGGVSFSEGGTGAAAYANAIRIMLALGISRLLNRASSLCIWDAGAVKVNQVFSRQAYSMTWFFVEANPFAGASGSFSGQIGYLTEALAALPNGRGKVTQAPAQNLDLPQRVVVSTDPPYYDSVPYADLADFFHVWLRRMLGNTLPTVFGTMLTPKADELVADQIRLGGKAQAAAYFEAGLAEVFSRIRDKHSDDFPMTVFYAFKAIEKPGESATGWETFLSALLSTGWGVVGTWPIRTEQPGGLRELGRNALASSVVVVCRKRSETAEAVSRRGFLQALQQHLPVALKDLEQAAIAPVDLAQAAIGPGMAVFSRYSRVVESDGTDMTVRTALALINQVLDEILSAQEGDFDADTRFCLTWYSEYGWNEAPQGRADDLARARNTAVDGLVQGGVFWARSNRARLLAPDQLSQDWNPELDERVSVWEVTIRLAHALATDGVETAARLMAASERRVDLDAAKELAYLLFSLSEKKNRAEAALLFNQLASSWPDLVSAARQSSDSPVQGTLTLDEGE